MFKSAQSGGTVPALSGGSSALAGRFGNHTRLEESRVGWANPNLGDSVVRRTFKRLATLALIGTVSASAGYAQEAAPAPAAAPAEAAPGGVEEIIVTSRFREESIQDVPLAVQQFGQEAIESIAPNTLRDFDGLAPNVFIGMNTAGPGASAIYIRGLGYADIEKTQTPNVGVVIDGIFVPSSTGQLIDTFDIEAIEINRGPQAILWGRNTSGGTIVVRRGQPKLGEWDAKLLTSYGNYDGEGDGGAFKVQAVANIPLNEESLALRLGYTFKDEDGYSKNIVNGENRGAVDYNAINAKLLWQATEEFSVLFNWDWIEDRGDIPAQDARWDANPALGDKGNDPYINKSDRLPKELAPYNVSILSLEANWEAPFGAKFTSITAYWDSHDLVYQDFDAGFSNPADPTQNDPQAVFARLHTRREQEFDTFSQELRMVGSLLDESLNYVGGFYYARDDHDHQQRTEQQLQLPAAAFGGACVPGIPGFSGPISPTLGQLCVLPTTFSAQETFLTNKSWALFASLEYELPWVEGLRINGGVRWINEEKLFDTSFAGITNSTLVGSVFGPPLLSLSGQKGSWDDVVFEAGVNYQLNEDVLTYYRFAQGFRSGGFSLRGSDPVTWSLLFDPENTDQHEVGVKTTWLDGRLVANLAAFYTKLEGGQFSSIISGVTAVGTTTLILNGGTSEIYGVEAQAGLELIEGLTVDFTLGFQQVGDNKSVLNTHNLSAAAGNTQCNPGGLAPPGTLDSEAECSTLTFRDQEAGRVPELTWSIGSGYRVGVGAGELILGARYRHNDDFWIIAPSIPPGSSTPSNAAVEQKGYSLLDANISYEFQVQERTLRVGFVGKNLTDKQYKEQELPLGPGGFRTWGPPRYLGGELQIEL